MRGLIDRVPAMVAYVDSQQRCRFANRACERSFGARRGSLVGRPLRDILGPIYPLDRPYIEAALRGEPQEFEREVPDPSGGPPRHTLAEYVPDLLDGIVRGFVVLVTDVSEVKRAQLALEQSEARLAGLVAAAPDAIISINEQLRIVLFNNGAESIFGWSRDEVMGEPVEVLMPERLRANQREYLSAFATGPAGSRRVGDLRALRKSGEEFPAEASVFNVAAGGARLVTVALRDVSDRERAAREREDLLARETSARERAEAANVQLRESEERFRLIVDEAPIGIALVALDGRFVRVNRVLCGIVGYTPEELTRMTFVDITHPDDVDTDLAFAEQLVRGEIPRYQRAKRYVRKDGVVVDIMLRASVLRGPNGEPRYYIAHMEDITEQRRAEREQRFLARIGPVLASTLEYDDMLTIVAELAVDELADLCIVDVLEDGKVRRAKVACRDPARRSVCEQLSRIQLDGSRPFLLRSVMATGQPLFVPRPTPEVIDSFAQNEEHRRVLHAAEIRSLVAAPLVARGTVLGGVAFVSSSRSRVYGPEDLRMAQELGQRAALSLDNARLYRMALRATQARDDVVAVVAHDLRNPLSSILMQAGLLRRAEGELTRGERTPSALIERAARRMSRLIQDLLDVSRAEAGSLSLALERVSPERLVSDSLAAHAALASAASVELEAKVPPNLPELWCDPQRLLQVFENLIGNALKFTQAGGTITLAAAPAGGEVRFSVADTGRGMTPKELPHVFDRFWQARKEERRRGAGLGLSIVKGIVEAHGGRVWVESVPERGSTFFFTVPTADRAQARPRPPPPDLS